MGYTHYWYRPRTISNCLFEAIRLDFEKLILPLSDGGVELAGALGDGPPELTENLISFNGLSECGHPQRDEISIAYPSEHAGGVGRNLTAIDGTFYNLGVILKHRCCNGCCSFETFRLAKSTDAKVEEKGLCCEYVKTGFRPYDIAVTSVLLIAKHHLREQFIVHSDGADAQWQDAKRICQRILGYGDWFGVIEEEVRETFRASAGATEHREVNLRTLIEIEPPKLG